MKRDGDCQFYAYKLKGACMKDPSVDELKRFQKQLAQFSAERHETQISKLQKSLIEQRKEELGLRCEVPNDKCCYFCLKDKPCLHEHKVRQETYGGAILGGMAINVHHFSYRVCDDCQKKLWARGIMMLLCAALLGGICGLMLSLLMKINCPSNCYVVKGICGVCYLAAILSLFNKHGQIRMNILWFLATVLFVMISLPLILHLRSLSVTLCICVLMALSFPTILLGLYKDINLFSTLYGRTVY